MEELKRKFLELLEVDVEFRYAVAGYLGLSEILKRLEEHDKKFNEILMELREHRKVLGEHSKRLEELSSGLQALGARWGYSS